MTENDFDRWRENLSALFPAVAAWIRNLGTEAGPLMLAWSDALADVELRDALEVNRRMLSGDDDGPGNFPSEWQAIPAKVRRASEVVRLRRFVDAHGSGYEPDTHEPRYKCRDCRDTGFVTVATREAQKEVLETGALTKCHRRMGTLLCNGCEVGRQRQKHDAEMVETKKRQTKQAVMSEWWFPVRANDMRHPDVVAEFVAWCFERKDAWFARNRHAEFDAYNQR